MPKEYLEKAIYLERSDIEIRNNKIHFINDASYLNDKKVIIFIHVSWCGWCTKVKPVYDAFAFNKKLGKNVVVCAIQADNIEEFGDFNDILPILTESKGYPSFVLIVDGKKKEYLNGDRTIQSFLEFVK